MDLVQISRRLAREVDALRFSSPVAYVYNPLDYAREPHERYLRLYGAGPKDVLLVGMNPGPFGMAQTGVPFGEVAAVRDWLRIDGKVRRPAAEHPKRPVLGFDCPRSEVSGARLWGWAKERFGAPRAFFSQHLVVNYCPLLFLESGGRNLTPDKIRKAEREPLIALCDEALRQVAAATGARRVLGVGRFAEGRARGALSTMQVVVEGMLHPSPASPAANRGWAEAADRALDSEKGSSSP